MIHNLIKNKILKNHKAIFFLKKKTMSFDDIGKENKTKKRCQSLLTF